jgi:hypothetical protein
MPQYQFVCRCVVGNEGCDCIPECLLRRAVPGGPGSAARHQVSTESTEHRRRYRHTTPHNDVNWSRRQHHCRRRRQSRRTRADGRSARRRGRSPPSPRAAALCLIITVAVIVVVVKKRKGGTKSGYDWASANRGRAATYASIIGDGQPQAQPAPTSVANIQVLGSSPLDIYMDGQQQQHAPAANSANQPAAVARAAATNDTFRCATTTVDRKAAACAHFAADNASADGSTAATDNATSAAAVAAARANAARFTTSTTILSTTAAAVATAAATAVRPPAVAVVADSGHSQPATTDRHAASLAPPPTCLRVNLTQTTENRVLHSKCG